MQRSKAKAKPRIARKTRVSRLATIGTRRDPRQERSRQTVDVIIEAAGQVLVEKGRRGVTTNAVAERAGVSIGSIYQYFPNKESIFEALQERHRDRVLPLIQHTIARLADPSVDIVAAMVGLMRAMIELHGDDPARLRAISEELHERMSMSEMTEFTDTVSRLLAARFGRSEGDVRPTAWLACMTLSHVGRTLVHNPPALDVEGLLAAIERMMRALFAALAS